MQVVEKDGRAKFNKDACALEVVMPVLQPALVPMHVAACPAPEIPPGGVLIEEILEPSPTPVRSAGLPPPRRALPPVRLPPPAPGSHPTPPSGAPSSRTPSAPSGPALPPAAVAAPLRAGPNASTGLQSALGGSGSALPETPLQTPAEPLGSPAGVAAEPLARATGERMVPDQPVEELAEGAVKGPAAAAVEVEGLLGSLGAAPAISPDCKSLEVGGGEGPPAEDPSAVSGAAGASSVGVHIAEVGGGSPGDASQDLAVIPAGPEVKPAGGGCGIGDALGDGLTENQRRWRALHTEPALEEIAVQTDVAVEPESNELLFDAGRQLGSDGVPHLFRFLGWIKPGGCV